MVIQRWQSVLLLLAVIMMAVFSLTPMATYTALDEPVSVYAKDAPVLLTVTLLVAVLLFISIFMYKNLKRQITVTLLSIILIAVVIVTGIAIVYRVHPEAQFIFLGGITLLVLALIFALGAYRCMKSDLRKLRSYDRLR